MRTIVFCLVTLCAGANAQIKYIDWISDSMKNCVDNRSWPDLEVNDQAIQFGVENNLTLTPYRESAGILENPYFGFEFRAGEKIYRLQSHYRKSYLSVDLEDAARNGELVDLVQLGTEDKKHLPISDLNIGSILSAIAPWRELDPGSEVAELFNRDEVLLSNMILLFSPDHRLSISHTHTRVEKGLSHFESTSELWNEVYTSITSIRVNGYELLLAARPGDSVSHQMQLFRVYRKGKNLEFCSR